MTNKPTSPTEDVLSSALMRLPEVMRVILLLNVYDDMRTCEIAVMIECDLRVVRSLRERALRILEKQLSAKQLAVDRDRLLPYLYRVYDRQIAEYKPDPACVERIRLYLAALTENDGSLNCNQL